MALDPAPLACLAGRFNFPRELVSSGRRCWAADHAVEVANKRKATGWTQARLAAHFGVSRPTIRRALQIAGGMRDDPTDEVAPTDRRDREAG